MLFFFLFDEYRSREGREFENIVSPDRSVRKNDRKKMGGVYDCVKVITSDENNNFSPIKCHQV